MAKREQEDAQEFLGYLLDTLHEELLSLKTTLKEDLQLQGHFHFYFQARHLQCFEDGKHEHVPS